MSSMSTLAADLSFDFTFPTCEPTTPPSYSFDPSLLEIPYQSGHARSSSQGSVYSFESSPSDSLVDCTSTRMTTPARSPVRTHGPLLLPKIRTQDQTIGQGAPHPTTASPPKRVRTSPSPARVKFRRTHSRSFTNPEAIRFNHSTFCPHPMAAPALHVSMPEDVPSNRPVQLSCSPVSFIQVQEPAVAAMPPRRASSCGLADGVSSRDFEFPAYRQMSPFVMGATATPGTLSAMQAQTLGPRSDAFFYQQQPYVPRESSPLAVAAAIVPDASSVDVGPTTTLLSYLTTANPAPALVRTISFPLRDPHTKHFWWDVRQVRPWTSLNAATIMSLPDAATMLSMSVPASLLPIPPVTQRHPETEAALYSIYSSYYLPKLNAALALSSDRPLRLSVPSRSGISATTSASECVFVANVDGESSSAAAIFGGKPTARVVGLVKSFDRFNTGMRVEGNIKRVEYLKGLAHLHHVMREHGCRYGFILTEIELVIVRNGADSTPHFGYLEVGSVHLAAQGEAELRLSSHEDKASGSAACPTQLTACLALWGLCMLAADDLVPGHAHWRSEIGAPAEGTRRKALPRDDWMPQPQLAEKREAKRARGWVFPEDPIGRKELGKRGVRYGGC